MTAQKLLQTGACAILAVTLGGSLLSECSRPHAKRQRPLQSEIELNRWLDAAAADRTREAHDAYLHALDYNRRR